MHAETLDHFRHSHEAPHVETHETRTRWVVVLTCGMMVGELIVGYATHSLALTADGWHMATHAGALGIVGGIVILRWGYTLCTSAARQLLDMVPSSAVAERVRTELEAMDDVRIVELHLWDVGPNRRSCIVSLVTSQPRPAEEYRRVVANAADAEHVTVEVHRCLHEGVG